MMTYVWGGVWGLIILIFLLSYFAELISMRRNNEQAYKKLLRFFRWMDFVMAILFTLAAVYLYSDSTGPDIPHSDWVWLRYFLGAMVYGWLLIQLLSVGLIALFRKLVNRLNVLVLLNWTKTALFLLTAIIWFGAIGAIGLLEISFVSLTIALNAHFYFASAYVKGNGHEKQ